MSPDEIRRAIEKVEWFHSIELGHGIVTPGVKGKQEGRTGHEWMEFERTLLHLPSVAGKSVLDIGTRDGFYAFEAERGGARRVTTIDDWDATAWTDHGFQLAKQILGSAVVGKNLSLYDLDPHDETYDITFFLGVIYHLKHPMWGLQRVADVTGEMIILESHFDYLDADADVVPYLKFLAGADLNNDPTNWWSPSALALKQMLRAVGFARVEEVGRSYDRVVLHAWK